MKADPGTVLSLPSPTAQIIDRTGLALVAGSALVWSFGGAIARTISVEDTWTVVFWRSIFAALFLLGFMIVRDGPRGAVALFRGMGWPGVAVGACFAVASISFVMAIGYTTVANVILVGAAVPLVAALIGWLVFRNAVSRGTWVAIAAVIGGVAIMVVGSSGDGGSLIGNLLALLMTVAFALATVITRQYASVRMTPAVCTGMVLAATVAGVNAGAFAVGALDLGLLFAFGALNLGLGVSLFVTGARLLPAALTGLIGTAETVLGPLWVWIFHAEVPAARTFAGGGVVLLALVVHIAMELRKAAPQQSPAVRST
ncbi:MAG TPA: DMT family transporter [Methylomirabilota bacterium]|nr:DMT family transporter [Methylomirabilota bacterium]